MQKLSVPLFRNFLRPQAGILLTALVLCCLGKATVAQAQTWVSHGPEGGAIYGLAIDPGTPTTLYAAAGDGGVFKSIDGGGSWSPINNGLAFTYVSTAWRLTP